MDLHLSISDGFVKTKIHDKRDGFDFDIVNFPFLDGEVPRSTSSGVYISQLIRFALVSSHVDDFCDRASLGLSLATDSRGASNSLKKRAARKKISHPDLYRIAQYV